MTYIGVSICNVYFPCDPRSALCDFTELVELLSDIETVVMNTNARNVLLVGDFNCHFQRNSRFTAIVENWLAKISLLCLWSCSDSRIDDVDYTYCNASSEPPSFSTIDHFAISENMLDGLVSAGVIHDGLNLSNHSPIYAKFNVGALNFKLAKTVPRSKVE